MTFNPGIVSFVKLFISLNSQIRSLKAGSGNEIAVHLRICPLIRSREVSPPGNRHSTNCGRKQAKISDAAVSLLDCESSIFSMENVPLR